MKQILWTLVFSAIFLFGLAMRSPEILAGNYLFGFDQGQNYIRAHDIAVNHKFTLIGAEVGSGSAGVPGLFHGPGFYYLLAVMIVLFQGDPYGGLVLMWVSGVATLLLVFLTTRKMFGEKTGLVAMFLVGICPMIAPQSRFVWGPHVGSFFLVLYYFALFKMQEYSPKWTFTTFFLGGILYHFELAISVPLVMLAGVALVMYKNFNRKLIVSAFLGLILAYAPLILFEVRHGFMATQGILHNITTKKQVKPDDVEAQKQGDFHIAQKQYQFIANFRDSFVFESGKIPPAGYMRTLAAVAIISMYGIYISSNTKAKRYFVLLGTAIGISFLVFLPLRGAIWPYYLIHLHFVYLYAFAYGATTIVKRLMRPQTNLPQRIVTILLSLFIIFFFLSMTQGAIARLKLNWLVDYYDYGGKEKIKGKRAIIDYVYADAAGKPFSVHVFMPPVYTWPYDYLFMTYGKEKYGYEPSRDKKGTGYMIIEMDGTKLWSYKGWLETVIIDGTPVWERYLLPSDHLLQKRIFN